MDITVDLSTCPFATEVVLSRVRVPPSVYCPAASTAKACCKVDFYGDGRFPEKLIAPVDTVAATLSARRLLFGFLACCSFGGSRNPGRSAGRGPVGSRLQCGFAMGMDLDFSPCCSCHTIQLTGKQDTLSSQSTPCLSFRGTLTQRRGQDRHRAQSPLQLTSRPYQCRRARSSAWSSSCAMVTGQVFIKVRP